MTNLANCEKGKKFKIEIIKTDKNTSVHLKNLGLFKGSVVQIVRKSPFKGPMVLYHSGSEIALGYDLAQNILGKII